MPDVRSLLPSMPPVIPQHTLEARAAALGAVRDTVEQDPRATLMPRGESRGLGAGDALAMLRAIAGERAREHASLELGETLGEGGMGIVRVALQRSIGRKVAVKTLRPGQHSDVATMHLLREAWVTGALEHPNVAPVYDVKIGSDGAPVIVLKRIEGVHWGELLGDEARVRERFRVRDLLEWNLGILMQVCNAAHFAHSRGIVHRDLKPENVMIGGFGEVYLLDWGIAVSLIDDGSGRLPLARDARQIAGTPCYMAPESLDVATPSITPRTDVFLLGAILYELLTGDPPHRGSTVLEIVANMLSREPPVPADAPAELVRICRRAMSLDPDGRFETAEQFRLAVQGYLQHRESASLAARADVARASLREVVASAVDVTTTKRQQAYDLFGACRFGYREALRIWPGNDDAREGYREAAGAMVAFELRHRDARAARVLLGEIDVPTPDLTAQVDALTRTLADEEQRSHELASLGRQFDASVGARTRAALAVVAGVIWTLSPFLYAWHESRSGAYVDLIAGPLVLIAMFAPVVWWARDSMAASRINRAVIAVGGLTLLLSSAMQVAGFVLGLPVATSGTLNLFLWGAVATIVAATLERRFAFGAITFFAAFLFAARAPAWRFQAMAASNAVLTLTMARAWIPRSR